MRRLQRLGWTVYFAELPTKFPWAVCPTDRSVMFRNGLSPTALRTAARAAYAAALEADRGPRPA